MMSRFSKKWATAGVFSLAMILAGGTARASFSYSGGFETTDGFTAGPMDPGAPSAVQGGWSGGSTGNFINQNATIVSGTAHTGTQSLLFSGTYNTPGPGTPFSPQIAPVDTVGQTFTGTVWFKAAAAGDGSEFQVDTGDPTGNDRAEILAYITAGAVDPADPTHTGLTVTTLNYPDGAADYSTVTVAAGLDADSWHSLGFSLTRTATGNALSISVDGGLSVQVAGYLAEYRDQNSFAYEDSGDLKFASIGDPAAPPTAGFYIDDVSYSLPEPASLSLIGLGVGALLARRRRA